MTKEQLWKIYTDKNPRFLEPETMITMPARSLKKLFDQTWDQARQEANRGSDFIDKILHK